MRRIPFIMSTALAALACGLLPSGALAHGRHHHHHARPARGHGHAFHHGLLGASDGSQPATPSTGPSSPPISKGTENVGPTPSNPQGNAGTVVSFTEGVLTIKMGEGEKATTISGKVTEETEIHCIAASALTSPSPSGAQGSGDDGNWDGSQGQQSGEPGSGADDQGAGDDGDGGDRNLEGGGNCNQCSTANLTPGTTVHRAELLLTESGAIFREIVLVL